MDVPDLVGLFVGPLESLGIPYMVTGGVASVIYGDPRFTRDIDLVVRLHAGDARPFAEAFEADAFYVPPVDSIREEAGRTVPGHFNVIHRDSALRADIYLSRDDPLHLWGFERRQRLALQDMELWIAPVEYVILRKLQYYRQSGSERHLRDIGFMLQISGPLIDDVALDEWVARLDLGDCWQAAQAHDPT